VKKLREMKRDYLSLKLFYSRFNELHKFFFGHFLLFALFFELFFDRC